MSPEEQLKAAKAARFVMVSFLTHGMLSSGNYRTDSEPNRVALVSEAEKLAALILERNPLPL